MKQNITKPKPSTSNKLKSTPFDFIKPVTYGAKAPSPAKELSNLVKSANKPGYTVGGNLYGKTEGVTKRKFKKESNKDAYLS